MDDHLVIVTVEYHAMADTPGEAISRVIENLYRTNQDLLPQVIEIKAEPR